MRNCDLQAVRPLIRFHMRFLYDVLHLVEHLSSLQPKYFQATRLQPSAEPADLGSAPPRQPDASTAGSGADPPAPFQLDLPVDFQVCRERPSYVRL